MGRAGREVRRVADPVLAVEGGGRGCGGLGRLGVEVRRVAGPVLAVRGQRERVWGFAEGR